MEGDACAVRRTELVASGDLSASKLVPLQALFQCGEEQGYKTSYTGLSKLQLTQVKDGVSRADTNQESRMQRGKDDKPRSRIRHAPYSWLACHFDISLCSDYIMRLSNTSPLYLVMMSRALNNCM